jgi:protein-tyrosine phosphatase
MNITRVLFVCLGNICRSPLAEALFLDHASKRGLLNQVYADSAGTSDLHIGDRPDSRTIKNAAGHGILLDHLGRQFSIHDFNRFDLILAMDQQNLRNILKLASAEEHKNKVSLIRNFDLEHQGADVPDPWYGGEAALKKYTAFSTDAPGISCNIW